MPVPAGRSIGLLAALALLVTSWSDRPPTPAEQPRASSLHAAGHAATSGSAAQPRRGGTLRWKLAEPASLDPAFAASDDALRVANAMFDSLTALDDDLEPVPAAATSWEANEDATVYTFQLREDARFHNGEPVVAEDFVRAFNRIATGAPGREPAVAHLLAPLAGFDRARRTGAPLDGVTAVDPRTLRLELQRPLAALPARLTHPALGPVPAAANDAETFAHRPIGNGPFAMAASWEHGGSIELERNEDYVGDAPRLDGIAFELYTGQRADHEAFADFEEGALDATPVPADLLPQAVETFGRSDDGYSGPGVLHGDTASTYYYGFGTERAPFDDPEVRRAFSMLIDRHAIAGELAESPRTPATSLVPPGIPGHEPGACDYCVFDPETAAVLLEGKDIGTVRLLVDEDPVHEAIAARVAEDVTRATDIDVEVVALPLPDYVDQLGGCDAGIFRFTWSPEHPTPDDVLFRFFASSRIGGTNATRYTTPFVDTLLDRARRTTDREARISLYQRAEARVLDDAAVAPIMYGRHAHVVADRVRGLELDPTGRVDLSRVWLAE